MLDPSEPGVQLLAEGPGPCSAQHDHTGGMRKGRLWPQEMRYEAMYEGDDDETV